MDTNQNAALQSIGFFQTELATARAFLDIAQTSGEEIARYRNVRNAELAITAIHEALAVRDIDPEHAARIRSAADLIAGRLNRLVAPVKFSS